MEIEQDFSDFVCHLESCSEKQRQTFEDIIEAFDTYVEEILLAFNVGIGATDSINVTNVLYNDFRKLLEMCQSDQISAVLTFLENLQKYEKGRLCCLQRNVALFRPSSKVDRMQLFKEKTKDNCMQIWKRKIKEEERADLKDLLRLSENALEIIMKPNVQEYVLEDLVQNMKKNQKAVDFQDETFNVSEINKRSLGKIIIKCIGHEGIKEKEDLRRLLQSCIDYLQNETETVWQNASITIYDEADNVYTIVSGAGKHQFICRMDDGEPLMIDLSSTGHKKRKTTHRAWVHPSENSTLQDYTSGCAIF